jgi:hypothetical protein
MSNYDERETAITQNPMHQQVPPPPGYGYGYAPYRRRGGYGMGMNGGGFSETTPFFVTSEFIGTLLCIVAIALTAAASSVVGARLALELIAGLVAVYTVSRGIAKSGTQSRAKDPRDQLTARLHQDGA